MSPVLPIGLHMTLRHMTLAPIRKPSYVLVMTVPNTAYGTCVVSYRTNTLSLVQSLQYL